MPKVDSAKRNDGLISFKDNKHSVLTRFFKLAYVIGFLVIQQVSFLFSFALIYADRVRESSLEAYYVSIPITIITSLIIIDFFGMTHFYRKNAVDIVVACFKLTAMVTLGITFFAFFFQYFSYPRYVIALNSVIMFIALSVWSVIFLKLSYLVYKKSRMIIIASDIDDAKKLFSKAKHEIKKLRIEYAGWVRDDNFPKIKRLLRHATEVLVSMNVSDDVKSEIILYCAEKDKTVYMVPQFYELAYSHFRIIQFYDTPTFMIDSIGLTFQQRLFKRVMDVILSIVLIILSLPLQLIIAALIKIDSKGPVFYLQERNTINSRIYNIYKFRTMIVDAEKKYGVYQARKKDLRLTKIGRFLRNTHLDEIPQFYNVLIGDISIVGPRSDRPITISNFEKKIPGYRQRLKVKSGITGLAQIMGKYDTDPEDKLRYDMIYLKNYSLVFDLKIILMTFGAMLPTNKNKDVDIEFMDLENQ